MASLGVILIFAGTLALVPLVLLLAYPQELRLATGFLIPATAQCGIGVALWKYGYRREISLSLQEGGIVVTLSWFTVVLFSAYPFMQAEGLNFSAAMFESASGWTSTGMTVVDVGTAYRLTLFWRSFLQYVGGAGLAIIMLSALVGVTGVGISSAEGRSDQLLPQVHQSARLVLVIYLVYAICGTLAYILAGMPWFDAINHSLTAVATGGFSSITNNFSAWHSLTIEWITIALMLLGNLSFVTAWFLFRGQFRQVFRNPEVRLLLVMLPLVIALLTIFTFRPVYGSIGSALRHACFESVAVLTTTGLSTVSFDSWNSFGFVTMLLLMIIGGGTCSTAGGIKQVRFYMILKLIVWEIRRMCLPQKTVLECSIWGTNRPVYIDDAMAKHCLLFVFLYLLTILIGTFILCACGLPFDRSLFEVTSSITSMGFTSGITSAQMPLAAIWTEIIAMILGRLELFVIFATFIKIWHDLGRMFRLPG
ncbi:MAG: TrkH family potassium uptake protein [Thermoguttaceae bacterium]|nr:TrkH family potassium uptake protein [Thermoguttaceae bacterium]